MEKRETLCTLDGILIGTSTMKSNEEDSQNIKELPCDPVIPLLGTHSKGIK